MIVFQHAGAHVKLPALLLAAETLDGALALGVKATGAGNGQGIELTEDTVELLGHTLLRWCEAKRVARALHTAQELGHSWSVGVPT